MLQFEKLTIDQLRTLAKFAYNKGLIDDNGDVKYDTNFNNNELLRKDIDFLELRVRTTNILKQNGIYHIGNLVIMSETELLNIFDMGKSQLRDIKEMLTFNKLSLR